MSKPSPSPEQSLPDASGSTGARERRVGRRVLLAGSVGTFVEFYDFSIYGFTVAIIATQFFPTASAAASILSAFAAYGVAFLMRPLGGVVFGALGDRIGRRGVLSVVLTLIGAATAAIGLLPTHAQVGVLAPLLLVLCRLVQGLSAGGEVAGATSFVVEHAAPTRRGYWIATVIAMSALPAVVAALLIFGLSSAMPASAFDAWGWRVPFLLALPLSLVGLYIRLKTDESPAFGAARNEGRLSTRPLRDSFRSHRAEMLFVFAFASLAALGFYLLVGYTVTYLQVVVGLSREQSLVANSVALLVFTVLLPLCGRISDSVGRKPMLVTGAVALAVVAIPAMLLASHGTVVTAVAGLLLLTAALCVFDAGCFVLMVEVFPTATRYTGTAVAYNIGYAVLGGTAPLVSTFLVDRAESPLAPGFYLAAVAVVVAIVAVKGPETARYAISR